MPLSAETKKIQSGFARYCRDPISEVPENIPLNRLNVYRDLVFSGVSSALDSAYPIAASILGPFVWPEVVRSFFAQYPSASPQLWQMPGGLVDYVSQSSWKLKFPFLLDLLRFEWLEIAVHMMPDKTLPVFKPLAADLLDRVPALNPEFEFIEVWYPVHRCFRAEELVKLSEPQALLVFRERTQFAVRFVEMSVQSRWFIEALGDLKLSSRELIDVLHSSTGKRPSEDDVESLLRKLYDTGFILGELVESELCAI